MGRNEDEIGRELRRDRPSAADEYVASLARSVTGAQRPPHARRRLAVAAALSVAALTGLALTGGIAQSSAAPKSVAKVVKTLVTPSKKATLSNVHRSAAIDQYGEKCNSGRGNDSEGSDSQLVDPHAGETGPGEEPTVDCDPGNSGGVNQGGD